MLIQWSRYNVMRFIAVVIMVVDRLASTVSTFFMITEWIYTPNSSQEAILKQH